MPPSETASGLPQAGAVAQKLLERRQSLYLGRGDTGVQFGSAEDHLLALGPTRCGKTTGLFIPSIAAHPGPVVVTSTHVTSDHPDIVQATVAARRAVSEVFGGPVLEVAIGGYTTGVAPSVGWSVTDGCIDWNTAVDRAHVLAATAMVDDKESLWRDLASDLLAVCLFAAALVGDDDRTMAQRIRTADLSYYHSVLAEEYGDTHDSVFMLAGLLSPDSIADDTRRSVFATVSSQILGQFRYEAAVHPESLLLDSFVESFGTIYVTVPPHRAEALRPLVSAFVEAVTAAWRNRQRREGTLLLALDEVANVAPLPNLPVILTAGAGSGIQCLLGMQEPGQANRWGDQATVITGAPTHVALFPGLRHRRFLADIAELLGSAVKYDLQVQVRSDTPQGTRFADEATLIAERLAVERARLAQSGRLRHIAAKTTAHRIAADRLRKGIHNREDGSPRTGETVLAELNQYTTVKQVPTRRLSVEADVIAQGIPGHMFLVSRAKGRFQAIPSWFQDKFWTDVLGPGVK